MRGAAPDQCWWRKSDVWYSWIASVRSTPPGTLYEPAQTRNPQGKPRIRHDGPVRPGGVDHPVALAQLFPVHRRRRDRLLPGALPGDGALCGQPDHGCGALRHRLDPRDRGRCRGGLRPRLLQGFRPAQPLGAGGGPEQPDRDGRGPGGQGHFDRTGGIYKALPGRARHRCQGRVLLGRHRGQGRRGPGRCRRRDHRDRHHHQGPRAAHRLRPAAHPYGHGRQRPRPWPIPGRRPRSTRSR